MRTLTIPVIALVAAMAMPASASADGGPLYRPATEYRATQFGVSPTAEAIATGDFTGDGRADIALTDEVAGGVLVMPGGGDGTIGQPRRFATGAGADAVSTGDLDGDGRLDLVVANGLAGTVSVLFGDGSGGFAKHADYAVGSAPGAIAIGHINTDSRLDFAVAANPSFVFLGAANRDFSGRSVAAGTSAVGLGAADLNGDARLDLVVGDGFPARLHVLLGRGDGTFAAPVLYRVPGWVQEAFRVRDVDGDGRADVVAVTSEGTGSVFRGRQDGSLSTPETFDSGIGSDGLEIADLNGDGRADLAINEAGRSELAIHLGAGSGRFTKVESHPVVRSAESVAAVDLNDDGALDLVTAPFLGSNIAVLIHAPPRSVRVVPETVAGMEINVVLPDGYHDTDRRYPVLYLLHPFNSDRDGWLTNTDLLAYTADRDVIVVLPSAGNTAGLIADGRDGSCRGETQLLRGVIRHVDAHYRTLLDRSHRAIAGASSGAFSAMHVAARHPDAFVAAASLSGPPDVTLGASPAGETYFLGAERDAVAECGGNPLTGGLFGTPLVDEVWLRDANPADLAPNFGGLTVYTGDGNGVPCDGRDAADIHRAGFTPVTRRSSESFVAALDRAGVPNAADLRHCGLHSWRYFELFLHAFWPHLAEAFGRSAPDSFDHRRAESDFTVWGWSFRVDPLRAVEFLDVRDASSAGVTVTGSGLQTISTAGYFRPGHPVRVHDGTRSADVVPDSAGRITVRVDLGPPHRTQQYRNPVAERADGYFTTRTVQFGPVRDYPAATLSSGLGAGAISAADFDGDADRDLVVSNCGGGGPSVLLNKGNAAFEPPRVIPSDVDACAVGVGDFNRDGHPDVVAGSYLSGNVTVLLGRGDGTFITRARYHSGNVPMQFAVADFDRDGDPDIASMNNQPGTVTMLLGNGDGTFSPRGRLAVANQAISIIAGDFDADGIPDLAVTDVLPDRTAGLLPGEVEVLLGKGDGTFRPRTTYGVGGSPEYVDAGDLDHDGHLDLVVANAIYNNDLSILYGIGGGRFAPEQRLAAPGMGAIRIAGAGTDADPGLQLADFDHDGHLDIAVIQTLAGKVVILRGDGRRHFSPAGQFRTANLPESFLAADLTGDGLADLAVPGNIPRPGLVVDLMTRVSVLVNRSAGA